MARLSNRARFFVIQFGYLDKSSFVVTLAVSEFLRPLFCCYANRYLLFSSIRNWRSVRSLSRLLGARNRLRQTEKSRFSDNKYMCSGLIPVIPFTNIIFIRSLFYLHHIECNVILFWVSGIHSTVALLSNEFDCNTTNASEIRLEPLQADFLFQETWNDRQDKDCNNPCRNCCACHFLYDSVLPKKQTRAQSVRIRAKEC